MNFSNMSPSHRLPFFTNCSSVGPSHGLQSFRNRLLQCGSPMGSRVLPANLLQCGLLSLHKSAGPGRSLLQHGLPTGSQTPLGASTCSSMGSSTGCRSISALLWTSMDCRGTACLTMVFFTGCRGISAPVPEAPPLPPSSQTLVSAGLFLSYTLTPLSQLLLHSRFSPS